MIFLRVSELNRNNIYLIILDNTNFGDRMSIVSSRQKAIIYVWRSHKVQIDSIFYLLNVFWWWWVLYESDVSQKKFYTSAKLPISFKNHFSFHLKKIFRCSSDVTHRTLPSSSRNANFSHDHSSFDRKTTRGKKFLFSINTESEIKT